jgi:hypothetical protein
MNAKLADNLSMQVEKLAIEETVGGMQKVNRDLQ